MTSIYYEVILLFIDDGILVLTSGKFNDDEEVVFVLTNTEYDVTGNWFFCSSSRNVIILYTPSFFNIGERSNLISIVCPSTDHLSACIRLIFGGIPMLE